MRTHRLVLSVLSTFCLGAATATPAGATEVSYVDGGQVWVSTLDGSSKRSLSGPSPDAKTWTEAAQAENGTVIGVRREPGKIGTLNATRLWDASGNVIGDGSLTARSGRTSYAYPVTLNLTPDGRVVTYGYANWSGFGLETQYEFGTYAEGSSSWYVEPFDVRAVKSGTLVGNRVVGVSGSSVVAYQNPTGQPPYSEEFTGWFEVGGVERVNVSANGKVAAVQVDAGAAERIAMIPFAGLGAAVPTDGSDCWLPSQGSATQASISADGTTMAWHDDRGVVVAGTPVWFATAAESTCNLSSPPAVISASGTMPSLGGSTAAIPAAGGGGATTGGDSQPPPAAAPPAKKGAGKGNEGGSSDPAAPTLGAVPKTVRARALAGGLALQVKVTKAGKVTATGKVGGRLVATASARARHPGKLTLRLKATMAWAKKLGRLAGKTLKVHVAASGGSVDLTCKLG
ncbi:MAG TPA: hypothetical protein VGC32_09750 [Solirubrobacterales bacterium]